MTDKHLNYFAIETHYVCCITLGTLARTAFQWTVDEKRKHGHGEELWNES
uniref:Uncharacterized protein n=1 Tax=Arion vulgaris TaxID=1028688 RepID=A0A0B7A6Z8_9EUPU